jgi:hypothetical protein
MDPLRTSETENIASLPDSPSLQQMEVSSLVPQYTGRMFSKDVEKNHILYYIRGVHTPLA